MFIRLLFFFLGLMILSLGIAMIIEANLGASAWDVLHLGLEKTLGLTVGVWSQIVGFIVIIITFFLDKKMITVGTVLNMIFVGLFLDLFIYILPTIEDILFQYLILLLGILVMGMGAGLYITAKLGPGPRDGLLLALSNRFKTGIGKIKTTMEITVLIIGWFLGGPVFIGTLIASVFIGPIMQFAIKFWEKRLNSFFADNNVSFEKTV